jgi:hypothetical protein
MYKSSIFYAYSLLFGAIFLANISVAWAKELSTNSHEIQSINVNANASCNSNKKSVLSMLWGKKSENKLYFEMFTLHVNPSSFKHDNWNQQLIGIQYNGFLASTLINSFYNRTYMIGISRTVLTKKYTNWDISLGYHLGLIYGYKPGQAPLSNLSPIIPGPIPFISTSYKKTFGAELNFVPDPSISLFLRF